MMFLAFLIGLAVGLVLGEFKMTRAMADLAISRKRLEESIRKAEEK